MLAAAAGTGSLSYYIHVLLIERRRLICIVHSVGPEPSLTDCGLVSTAVRLRGCADRRAHKFTSH